MTYKYVHVHNYLKHSIYGCLLYNKYAKIMTINAWPLHIAIARELGITMVE